MVKTKKDNARLPLVVTGYALFSLLVLTTLLSTTIPFGSILFNPHSLRFNVAVATIALTAGSILPALLGYIIGDHSAKSKSKLSHHFNGVLFGLFAYWLMMLLSVVIITPIGIFGTDFNARIILVNLFPSIGVAIVTTIFAIAHVRSNRAKQDILEYKPFSVALVASMVALPLWSLVDNIATNSVSVYSFISLTIVAVLGLISYTTLRKTKLHKYQKLVWSAVSVSVVYVTVYVSSQLVYSVAGYLDPRPTMESQAIVGWIGFIIALVGWSIYWLKQLRTLR